MSEPSSQAQHSYQELIDRMDVLGEEVARIRAAVEDLRSDLSDEVRTRSIVVVDDEEFERVVIAARAQHGSVSVYGRSPLDRSTCAELFANDPIDGDGAHAGVSIIDEGEVVAALEVLHGTPAQLHIDAPER